MVRLSADLLHRSPQYFNAVRDREIDLRGNKIAVIENLGATEDSYDSIDLSDNEIVKLEGFPVLKRLSRLLLNNNKVARINPNIGAVLPKLTSLVLTGNRLVNLSDLDPLASLPRLASLSCLDNSVAKKPSYRLYAIHKLPTLTLLDFRKIKKKEREEADRMFGSTPDGQPPKSQPSSNTFVPGEALAPATSNPSPQPPVSKKGPTAEQITAIKAAIASAQTLEEVARLERALTAGGLPGDVTMMEE